MKQFASKTTITTRFINNTISALAALDFCGQWIWAYSKFRSNAPEIFKSEFIFIEEYFLSNYHFRNYNPPSPIFSDSEHTLSEKLTCTTSTEVFHEPTNQSQT